MATTELTIRLPKPYPRQREFVRSPVKRIVVRAGRRSGKTVGMAVKAVEAFLKGRRILYATPTADQINTFWRHVKNALQPAIDAGIYYKNETERVIELAGTEQRIKAKTAWNADTLRGDYADLLILDEWQLMNEDAWGVVGAPMLLDNNGDVVFIYTPPSARTVGVSKAKDKRHAAKLFKRAQVDDSGRWAAFTFSSHENPHLSREALDEIAGDMSNLAYRQEIMAEDIDEVPGALWTHSMIDADRVSAAPELRSIVVGVDPKASQVADSETGIVVAGIGIDGHGYVLGDYSLNGSPEQWAAKVAAAYEAHEANSVVVERNNGGDMVRSVLKATGIKLPLELVWASRGKQTRAEPIVALYEQHRIHHLGSLPELEDQMCVAADTLVATATGQRRIDTIRVGDMVWTRKGLCRVRWAGQTGIEETITLHAGEHQLTCTPSHPVHVADIGFQRAVHVVPTCDIITTWNTYTFVPIAESLFRVPDAVASHVLRRSVGKTLGNLSDLLLNFKDGNIIRMLGDIGDRAVTLAIDCFTEISGKATTAPFLTAGTFTTSTAIQATMSSKTLPLFLRPSIISTTAKHNRQEAMNLESKVLRSDWRGGPTVSRNATFATSADRNSSQSPHASDSARLPAIQSTGLGSVEKSARQPVYNLTVEDQPEYFANGILVHNCEWVPAESDSPDRLDAAVWAMSKLMLRQTREIKQYQGY